MEKLFFDLTEHEFSRGRKVLLWIFCFFFFIAGMGIIFMNVVLHQESIHITFSIAPFGISIFVGAIAILSSIKRTDLFFQVDDEGISYRFGLFRPARYSFKWEEIKEIRMPHRDKRFKIYLHNDESYMVNLNWIEKRKTSIIRKHVFYSAKDNNISVVKVQHLSSGWSNKLLSSFFK